jgi:histidinol phosphatase-like enzyme (inositol monophosphatase family)
MIREPELRALLDFAGEAARQAGQLTLAHFRSGVRAEAKADGSPVTAADRGAEDLLRELIAARHPDHSVIGEERGADERPSPFRWWIDPIDGTRAFVRGVPLYGVLLGIELEGEIVAGVAHFPALGETLSAARGLGCSWNGRPARVSSVDSLDRAAVLASDFGELARLRPEAWRRLVASPALQRGWGDCYGHCLVATGRAEVMLDPVMNPWDCAALLPIVEEAGGRFADWSGARRFDGGSAVSTNRALLEAVRRLLDGDPDR